MSSKTVMYPDTCNQNSSNNAHQNSFAVSCKHLACYAGDNLQMNVPVSLPLLKMNSADLLVSCARSGKVTVVVTQV